jgi:hypothetical protein
MARTKDDFLARWQDELNGLLLAAFVEERKGTDFARDGRFMVQQMRRARDLLQRIYCEEVAQPLPAKPAETNGQARKA